MCCCRKPKTKAAVFNWVLAKSKMIHAYSYMRQKKQNFLKGKCELPWGIDQGRKPPHF